MKYSIIRPHLSKALHPSLIEWEEKIFGEKYAFAPKEYPQAPYLVISDSHIKKDSLPEYVWQQTRLLIHANSGFDNLLPIRNQFPIPVVTGNPIRAQAVAQTLLSEILGYYTKTPTPPFWDRHFYRKLISEVHFLVIGVGHIGHIVCSALECFGSKVSKVDPAKGHQSLAEIALSSVDAVVLCCDLNDQTRHLVNHSFMNNLCKPFAIFNASRGEIIKIDDLITLLKNNVKNYAYLDVLSEDACREQHLYLATEKLSNLKLSCHVAGVYDNLTTNTFNFIKEVINHFEQMDPATFREYYLSKHQYLGGDNEL